MKPIRSLKNFSNELVITINRFPVVLIFIFVSAVFYSILEKVGDFHFNEPFTVKNAFVLWMYLYPVTAAVLSFALYLFGEQNRHIRKRFSFAAHTIWFLFSIYLVISSLNDDGIGKLYAIFAVCTTVFALPFLLPFWDRNENLKLWNFTDSTLKSLPIIILMVAALFGGIVLLFLGFKELFDIKVPVTLFYNTAIICWIVIAPILFLMTVPKGESHLNSFPGESRFMNGVMRFLFVPLLLFYIFTLYAYGFKILFTLTLPCGWVSKLVTASVVATIIITSVLYPAQFREGNFFDRKLQKFLPLMLLPLLVLMSVGIARRFFDYSVTIPRLYLLLFNGWCYVAVLIMVKVRKQRLWWLLASFCMVLLFSSIGPQSVANTTKRILLNDVIEAFKEEGFNEFPLNENQYKAWQTGTLKKDPRLFHSIETKLHYIQENFGENAVARLFTYKFSYSEYKDSSPQRETFYASYLNNQPVDIPANRSRIIHLDMSSYSAEVTKDSVYFTLNYITDEDRAVYVDRPSKKSSLIRQKFSVSLDTLQAYYFISQENKKNKRSVYSNPLTLTNENASLVLDEFHLDKTKNNAQISIRGEVFLK